MREMRGRAAGRQHDDLVARAEDATRDLAGIAPEVVVLVGLGPDDPLDREPGVDEVAVGADVHVLEVVQQRRPLVPGHRQRPL